MDKNLKHEWATLIEKKTTDALKSGLSYPTGVSLRSCPPIRHQRHPFNCGIINQVNHHLQ